MMCMLSLHPLQPYRRWKYETENITQMQCSFHIGRATLNQYKRTDCNLNILFYFFNFCNILHTKNLWVLIGTKNGDFMALKFKDRKQNPRKKILVYGLDGTGKSTFAFNYCEQNGLKPVVIDIDDTNFTPSPILDLHLGSDVTTYQNLKKSIEEIGKSDDFDTIILDGVTSLLEMLVSKSKGLSAYSDRSKRWNDLLFKLDNTRKNIIFIGQIDMEMMFNEDYQPSKAVIKVNSLVNEKYKCFIDEKGNYSYEVKKLRTIEELEAESSAPVKKQKKQQKKSRKVSTQEEVSLDPIATVEEVDEKKANSLDNAEEIAMSIVAELPQKNMLEAKKELARLLKLEVLTKDECKEILKQIGEMIG